MANEDLIKLANQNLAQAGLIQMANKNLAQAGMVQMANKNLARLASAQGVSDKINQLGNLFTMGITDNSDIDSLVDVFDQVWGASYLFMVRLQDGIDSPLSNFILPASAVTEKLPSVTSLEIPLPTFSGFKIPTTKGIPEISITIYDTEDCMAEKSLRAWIVDVNDGVVCNYLDNLVKNLSIYKLNYERNIIFKTEYKVIPVGDIQISMSSRESTTRELTVNFLVTSYLG